MTAGPYPAPVGATARRLEWQFLPPALRAAIERRCGAPVVEAISRTAGFTPGFASALVCADGSRHFVKAASVRAQRTFADSYREEARKLALLPRAVPAPALQWWMDGDWVVLGIEYVDGATPTRPWRRSDLDHTLDALETVVDELTPPPGDLHLEPARADFHPLADAWEQIRRDRPDLPHLDEAAVLAERSLDLVGGSTLVHTDIRDDNLLVRPDGTVWICDWNWPVVGADWIDSLFALVGPRGDGLDVEAVIAERRLLRDLPAETVDAVLALLVGYFLASGELPVPPTSPHLRDHQRWQGEVCWHWLCERRGWT